MKLTPNEIRARMLYRLVKEHKKICNSDKCGISTVEMGRLYVELKGRPLTKKEMANFL
jgi:hypothetical protein